MALLYRRARSSILSGRYPYHLGLYNNNEGDFPLSYALLPALLKQPPPPGSPRWAAHALGKWHLGWAFLNYTATFRGFDTFFGSSGNTADYWAHTIHGPSYSCDGAGPGTWRDFIDARGNEVALAPESAFGVFDSTVLTERALAIVGNHSMAESLYLYFAFHNVHEPPNAPQATVDRFPHIAYDRRKITDAMLTE